jgi:hypothetical protein
MSRYGVRGSRNPYKNVKPMPTKGPQSQLVNPTANNGKGPQGQQIFENEKNASTETTE